MSLTPRISSILKTHHLDNALTGVPSFKLSELELDVLPTIELPSNRRLGHLAEKVVSELIKASSNFEMLHENVQLIEEKTTIGELDFIIRDKLKNESIHLELAYKFYLYDPSISAEQLNNWIGPNRNDSLVKKLAKLQNKQFPLLHHPCAQAVLGEVSEMRQELCFLVSLFVPYDFKTQLNYGLDAAVVGYYLNMEQFRSLDKSSKTYFLPPRKSWGIDPSTHDDWQKFSSIEGEMMEILKGRQAVLCWQKDGDEYSCFFIVWW